MYIVQVYTGTCTCTCIIHIGYIGYSGPSWACAYAAKIESAQKRMSRKKYVWVILIEQTLLKIINPLSDTSIGVKTTYKPVKDCQS